MKIIIRDQLLKLILRFKRFRSSDSIIIFSEARGGSTWLMEMLNEILEVSINWEPLHLDNGVIPQELNFGWRPFIPDTERNDNLVTLFNNIHKYKLHNKWSRKYLSLRKLVYSKHVLVKYVRANMLVPFLLKNLTFKYNPIFLIRHPIDICISQIEVSKGSYNDMIKNEIPKCINNERFLRHKEFMDQLNTKLELKVANWCLNNCTALEQIGTYCNVYVMYYSDLLLSPERELRKFIENCGLMQYNNNLNKVNYRKASSTTFKNGYCDDVEKQLNKNFYFLTKATKDKIQKIFDHFGFKLYSAYSPLPEKRYLKYCK